MMLNWRVISLVALVVVTVGASYLWWERGIRHGDYFRAGIMIGVIWAAFYFIARVSVVVPDPALRRVLLAVAAALALSILGYHAYKASSLAEIRFNLVLVLGIGTYSYLQIFGREST